MEKTEIKLDYLQNKKTFQSIVKKHIKRNVIDEIMSFLEETDFYRAPASSRFHLACPGGLCQHSMNVYKRLIKEYQHEYNYATIQDIPEEKMETIAIVSLFHDICKANFYEESTRNVKKDGVWIQVPFYMVNEQLPMGHGEKSVFLLMKHMKLSDEEITAINGHMGFSDDRVRGGNYSIVNVWEQYPLGLLLHVADIKATKIDEVEMEN